MQHTDDDQLLAIVRAELDEGVAFLDSKGHPGATLSIAPPDRRAITRADLGGRFAARPDRSAFASIEIDPARVGWRVVATLDVWLDSRESSDSVELGEIRLVNPTDPDYWARVLVRAPMSRSGSTWTADASSRSEFGRDRAFSR